MKHTSVLLEETIEALAIKRGGLYVDGTLGRAGHAKAIIARGGKVLGIDRDEQALAEIGEVEGLTAVKGNHGDLKRLTYENDWHEVDGVILDLGVSSPQLDEARRGFSFQREGPLDMRMDRSRGLTAAVLVNGSKAAELERIFRTWGEEPNAWRIARGIEKRVCEEGDFTTTTELAEFIERMIGRRNGKHPATRVFQALRMAVNDEEGELERALAGGLEILRSGGRFAVITFESLTDRAVKRFFAAHVGKMVSLQQGGDEWVGELPRAKAVFHGSVTASEEELRRNPRARSARLRVVEKI